MIMAVSVISKIWLALNKYLFPQAFYTRPKDCYDLHWPMRCGRLNVHFGVGGSLNAISQDLEDIWSEAIQGYLDIPLKDLKVGICRNPQMKFSIIYSKWC